ncbi:MAG: trans-sulfuration enzyme family protein [Fusobacteriaceae bacterium]
MEKYEMCNWEMETLMCQLGEDREKNRNAAVPPIYQTAAFDFEKWEDKEEQDIHKPTGTIYSRGNNPTYLATEQKLAALAGGERAKLFASGMAAITAAIFHFIKGGDHVVCVESVYDSTHKFFKDYLPRFGVETTFVSGENPEEFHQAIKPNTSLIFLESPSSTFFKLQDIKKVVELAKKNKIKTIIDNTYATPIFQRPLELGVDLEVQSCTKFLCGHGDVVAGVIIGKAEDMDKIFDNEYMTLGGKTSPMDAWLILRGLRTLHSRMKIHHENGYAVAKYLEQHEKVEKIIYPGLESFNQKKLADDQMSGFSGVMTFSLKTKDRAEKLKILNSLKLVARGVSFGSHQSVITTPIGSNPGSNFELLRIGVGLENIKDIIYDLEQALKNIK